MDNRSLKFSGHESFHCRPFWLKKGFDHIVSGKTFNDQAGVELGVGRNMIASIRFWMKAFDLIDKNAFKAVECNNILSKSTYS